MTNEEYKAAIKAMGLSPMKPSHNGSTMHQTRDGSPQLVEDPERFSPPERDALIEVLRFRLSLD